MIEIHIFNKYQSNDKWIVNFKYWVKGDCACGAIRAKREFDNEPTLQDIKKSI